MRNGFIVLIVGIILCAFAENDYRDRLADAQVGHPEIVVTDYSSVTGWIGVLLFIVGGFIIAKHDGVTVEPFYKKDKRVLSKKNRNILVAMLCTGIILSVFNSIFDHHGASNGGQIYKNNWENFVANCGLLGWIFILSPALLTDFLKEEQ